MLQPDHPLPPYRYVPGRNPHPRKHPDGHAFGRSEPAPDWPTPGTWASCPLHRHAVDLFNRRYWWEAHEAWEALWHLAPADGPERRALQGLIQAAACRLKRLMGQRRASAALLDKARANLRAATPRGRLVLAIDCHGLAELLDLDDDPVVRLEESRTT